MSRFTRLLTASAVLVLLTVATIGGALTAPRTALAQAGKVNCAVDLANVNKTLADATAEYAKGNTDAGREAVLKAQTMLSEVISRCAEPAAKQASCTYSFDATVRSGASKGANVRGIMTLVELKANEFAGFVVDRASMKAGGKPEMIPVEGKVESKKISLTFTLKDKSQIKGVGAFGDKLSDCTAAVEGDLTGPKADDTGDWLGALNGSGRSSCISAGIRRCVSQFGANGSAACGADAAAACVALYP
jgi:hypothetical protein